MDEACHDKQEAQSHRTDTEPPTTPSLRAYHGVTAPDRGPAPGLVTGMKSEAAVGADHRSAPHSSAGVLMASDSTGGRDGRSLTTVTGHFC